ncbi:MAG: response regulator [bacterium]|nr:response regulator [bacterium]
MSGNPIRVLVVDDEEVVLETLTAFLEDWGYRVFNAEEGDDGLEILRKEHIDIAIVDMRLRNYDGNTFILKAHQVQPRLQFLIHTGSAFYSIPPEIAALGISEEDILWKPIRNFNALFEIIERKTANQSGR